MSDEAVYTLEVRYGSDGPVDAVLRRSFDDFPCEVRAAQDGSLSVTWLSGEGNSVEGLTPEQASGDTGAPLDALDTLVSLVQGPAEA